FFLSQPPRDPRGELQRAWHRPLSDRGDDVGDLVAPGVGRLLHDRKPIAQFRNEHEEWLEWLARHGYPQARSAPGPSMRECGEVGEYSQGHVALAEDDGAERDLLAHFRAIE